jgi:hypothetical protein
VDIISPINNALALLARLKETSGNITETEVKDILEELDLELANTKLVATELQAQIDNSQGKDSPLEKPEQAEEKPKIKNGCYYFNDSISWLYCTACYDSKGVKSKTQLGPAGYRICRVCKASLK